MKKFILKTVVLLLTSTLIVSCVNSDTYGIPEETLTTYQFTTTKTVQEINDAATASPVIYTGDDIIEGYVTSSDEKGTFYKSISFQSKQIDGGSAPIGFSVPINITTLYGKGFTPGRKVYIKLKGLYIAKVFGSMQIGTLFNGQVGRLTEFEWQNYVFPSATKVSEESLVRTLSLATAFNDANQNTLVELDNVQFTEESINRTYYDVDSGGGATNHLLVSGTGGTQRIIRFSSFAPFTGNQVPTGNGKIRGVLSKFSTTFQFVVRYENDIKLINPRVDVYPAFVGNANVFSATVNEPFTSYLTNQTNFPKYINDAFVGSRYWQVKNFSSNNYIEMSAFNGAGNPGVKAKTYFFVPVDFTAANSFTFKEEMRFNSGEALKVYYVSSANYTAGSVINLPSFTNISGNFNITYPANGASENSFNSAGTYAIPASLTGTGYFVFEYTGTTTVTTTVQIDDVVIN